MKLLKTLLATALVAASLLPAAHAQERTIKSVSYTHLTLPTTPYV